MSWGALRSVVPANLDANTLIGITGLKVGDPVNIPGEEIGKAIRRLWEQGIFLNRNSGDLRKQAPNDAPINIFRKFLE